MTRRQIVVNDWVTLDKVVYHQGMTTKFYTAFFLYAGKRINVTYNCVADNLIIHEWYKLPEVVLKEVSTLIHAAFLRETAFDNAMKTMDKYIKAIEMGFPDNYVEKIETDMDKWLNVISMLDLSDEFADFATTI